jgi:regulator of sigma E protease
VSSILIAILGFVLAIGVLVTVHEFGHFWVARRCGVRVLRFSIGFGRPLWSRRLGRDRTEYCIGSIPLGGYVKMLDEREAPVPESEVHRTFNRQSIPRRTAIVVAGPAFNFAFAILAYWMIFVLGIPGLKPVVGEVLDGSPAAEAGLQAGDEIREVSPGTYLGIARAALELSKDHLNARRHAHSHAALAELVENPVVAQRQRFAFASVDLLRLIRGELLLFDEQPGKLLAIAWLPLARQAFQQRLHTSW